MYLRLSNCASGAAKIIGMCVLNILLVGVDEQMEYEAHVAAAHAANEGMPAVMVNHGGVGEGSVPKDIRMENFSISMGGKELINEAAVTLAYGRRYGECIPDQLHHCRA